MDTNTGKKPRGRPIKYKTLEERFAMENEQRKIRNLRYQRDKMLQNVKRKLLAVPLESLNECLSVEAINYIVSNNSVKAK